MINLNIDLDFISDIIFLIILMPISTALNILQIIVTYKKMYNGYSTKILYIVYLCVNILGILMATLNYVIQKYMPYFKLCFFINYITFISLQWSMLSFLLILFDRYVQMNKKKRYIQLKTNLLIMINILFIFISAIAYSPKLYYGTIIQDSIDDKFYFWIECKAFSKSALALFDFIEFTYGILLTFPIFLLFTLCISWRLVKSKKKIRKNIKKRLLYKREIRYTLIYLFVNLICIALFIPTLIVRYVKHNSIEHDLSNKIYAKKLLNAESISTCLRTLYFMVPFVVNLLINPLFRRRLFQVLSSI